nr:unnamed protein product [Digitaria exilis]CAB3457462.1 unnamed protein product [Digitaria exilis]
MLAGEGGRAAPDDHGEVAGRLRTTRVRRARGRLVALPHRRRERAHQVEVRAGEQQLPATALSMARRRRCRGA